MIEAQGVRLAQRLQQVRTASGNPTAERFLDLRLAKVRFTLTHLGVVRETAPEIRNAVLAS